MFTRFVQLLVLLFVSSRSFAQVPLEKYPVATQVFTRLTEAYGSNKAAPAMKIIPKRSPGIIAQYIAYPSPTIEIDEVLIELCQRWGKDSANALAIVLGHELAHYYSDHNWCSDYAWALRNTSLGEKLNTVSKVSKIEKESIADGYSLYYAALAGYQAYDIFDKLLDQIYRYYKLPEKLAGYPSKKERKEVNRIQKEKIQMLVPVFEAGIVLKSLKHYEEAATCFEYLTSYFPGREIYNNYGVCKLLLAQYYQPVETIKFIYPIEVDPSSRIYPQHDRGGDTLNREQKFNNLLQEAKRAFEKAISFDERYLPSYLNLACLHDLRGNFQAALGVVHEAQQTPDSQNNDLQLIKAISLYHLKNDKDALRILQQLNTMNNDLYAYNYGLLSNCLGGDDHFKQVEKWKDDWVRKKVAVQNDTCHFTLPMHDTLYTRQRSLLAIQGALKVGKTVGAMKTLAIEMKRTKLLAQVVVENRSGANAYTISPRFAVSNGKCMLVQFPKVSWRIHYKEFSYE